MAGARIRVFLVDDSPLALVMLKRLLATAPDIEIVGTARNGREALALLEAANPDVLCTDYQMPEMDGLELIERVMAEFPCPILVISSILDPKRRDKAFPLLAAGAIDIIAKPDAHTPFEQSAAQLCQKIRLLSGIVVISRRVPRVATTDWPGAERRATPRAPAPSPAPVSVPNPTFEGRQTAWPAPLALRPRPQSPIRVVAIGASTGGPQVLQTILGRLPDDFPCPVVCVQHISAGFLEGLVVWLDSQCRVRVKIAAAGEAALAGTVYFPPENHHMEIDGRGRLQTSDAPAIDGHRPSVTVTFESVARHFGSGALGVLLTGMGDDGASGLEAMARAGAVTFAQNEASCVVFGMPRQAISRGAAQFVLAPDDIADSLLRLTVAAN